jgi:iron complex outermembrane recepter protein
MKKLLPIGLKTKIEMKTAFKFLILFCLLCSSAAVAQEAKTEEVDLYELSLEELLNIPINSASKKDETLFDAPLSSYTITRADIDKSGVTSIMEALRLAPGVIVREQTNGVYDIHIRGLDNILRTSLSYTKSNLTTLVMIDNRPVFNHNLGGTFWEALPVDLNDVERIEIVRGPSAPLFGPNAVTGVINIMTKRSSAKTYVNANVQYGTPSTAIANAAFGKKIGDKVNFIVSGNYQDRERFDETYYNPATGNFEDSDFITDVDESFPDQSLALNRKGINGFINFRPSENMSFDLSLGAQSSEAQKIFVSDQTLFTTNLTQTQYGNLSAKIHSLALRASYLNGHDDLNKNSVPSQYNYKVADIVAEYEIAIGKKLSVVPGLSYQDVTFDDTEYAADGPTFLGGKETNINTTAGFVRLDAKPTTNWRIIGAIRADKFSTPDDIYLAYEFATTYKLNEKNLVRAAYTRSNSGSFIAVNYLDVRVPLAPGVDYLRTGNPDHKLFTVNMIELGYRVSLTKNIQLDIDLFNQVADNYYAVLVTSPISQQVLNIPTTAVQNGITLGINYVPNDKLQIKPFVTFQKTETKDLPSAFMTAALNPAIMYSTSDHKNTPSFYGGYFINYKPLSKLNLNLNGYYYASHRQYDASDPLATGEAGDINGKFLVNLKANWSITKTFGLFLNGRNIFNDDSREFFGTDQIGGLYTAGATFSLN